MKKTLVLLIAIGFVALSCSEKKERSKQSDLKTMVFSNPILKGFYPDPSICKVEGSYYLVNSTFAYFPGIPIFKSDDLINWEQIGNVLDRPEQLNLDGLEVSQGVFAPAIRYSNGVYYVTCTIVGGKNNFVVTATDPSGPWSDPVWVPEVEGIDPSFFFDDDNRSYIIYNSDAPDKKPLYDGHRTIKMVEFDVAELKVKSKPIILVNGGTDLSKKPIWIEGPHIYKKNGYYYLMAAEGGTAEDHSEVVFRSHSVTGPYESYPQNPILTQRQLPEDRENPVTSTGHADIFEDGNGDWWGVFLGCRPYSGNHFNTGRETFMAPVVWKDNWPVFDLKGDVVKKSYDIQVPKGIVEVKGDSTFFDDFSGDHLNFKYNFLRTPRTKWFALGKDGLTLQTRPESCSNKENPSFIGIRQPRLRGEVSVAMNFETIIKDEKAGLVVFQNAEHYYYLSKSFKDGENVIQLLKSNDSEVEEMNFVKIDSKKVYLKIIADNEFYHFYCSNDNKNWIPIAENVDARFLSTTTAGGFVGCYYAMYTTSLGNESANRATYEWLKLKD
ncbi:glycoside hydrolase family 43 protein [Maribacter sp. TH_r10]|uniref:glycoside hydrolase family 43 protein n=1 Tax=Maribacter sp. TH_r10 TaxID=3082086 RepID=UPI002954F92B|nr:glycoside hydrolase family 43 protein [Maribacter sp. TH_r10]MDV7140559.1 glycoside hydrolase family 43 protein [Maribacter sp. TH_r10]